MDATERVVTTAGSGQSDEMAAMVGALAGQRRHVLAAIDGLSLGQLTRPVLPSGWSCLGMLKHLALSDEHYWVRSIVGGQPLDDFFPTEEHGDWLIANHETAETIIDLYQAEIAESDKVLAAVNNADQPPAQQDPVWDQWGVEFPTVRSVMLHLITETACHAGHLDAARELLDGKLHLVL